MYGEATEHAAKQKAESAPHYFEEGNNSAEKHARLPSKIHKCATDQRKANTHKHLSYTTLHCTATVTATLLLDSSRLKQSIYKSVILQARDDQICFTLRVLVLQMVRKILLCSLAGICILGVFK